MYSSLIQVEETEQYLQYKEIPKDVHDRVDEFFQQKYPTSKYVRDQDVLQAVSRPLRDRYMMIYF